MALKVNGISVVDNNRNITNVNNTDSAGISTVGHSVVVKNSGGTPTITLDGTSGIATASSVKTNTVNVGSAVTISSNGSTSGGVTVSGVVTATSYVGSGSSLTGLTGAAAGTYGNASQVAQITVDANNKITSITNVNVSGGGGGGGGSTTEGMGTALSADATSLLSIIYKTPKSFTIADNTTVTVQSDSGSDNFAYTKLAEIVVGSGAVLEIANDTILRMNILNIF